MRALSIEHVPISACLLWAYREVAMVYSTLRPWSTGGYSLSLVVSTTHNDK